MALREAGLAWSTAICATIQALVLLGLVRRHARAVLGAGMLASAARSIVITVLMGLAVVAVPLAPPVWRLQRATGPHPACPGPGVSCPRR